MINYYGEDADYIHLKFGDMRKQYFFTKEFREAHPTFCKEYEKYWNRDASCRFEDPMQIVNYVQMWGIPVHFYFNYTDTPAKNNREIMEYLIRERVPADFGKWVDGDHVGWDGESENPDDCPRVVVSIDNKSRTFDSVRELIEYASKFKEK